MSARRLRRSPAEEQPRRAELAPRASRVPLSAPAINGNAWTYVKRCLDAGEVSAAGEFGARFEAALSDYTGAPQVVATSCGTAALHLACLTAGVGPGDTVLVPSLTFVATANAVTYCGAEPWFVDADPGTWNLSAATLARALGEARAAGRSPRAVVVTHLYGVPAEMDGIVALCAREGLALVEDAAESLGSWWRGRHTGTFGRAAALSFNGNKIITAGQGGALLLGDAADARRARHLATQARASGRDYVHDAVGFNYRMANLNAALGLAQFEELPRLRARRRALNDSYRAALQSLPGLIGQSVPEGGEANGWLTAVRLAEGAGLSRDALLDGLDARGIEARPVFAPLHAQAPFRGCGGDAPVATRLAASGINLPSGPDVDASRVIAALRALLR